MKLSYMASLSVLFLFCSCANVQYLDRPTPPGNPVPPPVQRIEPVTQEVPKSNPLVVQKPYAQIDSLRTADSQFVVPGKTSSGVTAGLSGNTLYNRLYTAQGKPRIAIFLNRELSDEVRQWATQHKLTTAGSGELVAGGADFVTAQAGGVGGKGNQTIYEQEYVDENRQTILTKSNLWEIEQGFTQPFLDAGTSLVDRATIMRLSAASQKNADNSDVLVSPKLIEIRSLEKYADIFIELLVMEDPGLPIGFYMKASAKEVKTGKILVQVNTLSWNWDELLKKGEIVVAVADGYEFQETQESISLDAASSILATDVMDELCSRWRSERKE